MDIKLDQGLGGRRVPTIETSRQLEESRAERQQRLKTLTRELSMNPARLATCRGEAARLMGGIYFNTGVSGADIQRQVDHINALENPADIAANYLTVLETHEQRRAIQTRSATKPTEAK